MACGAVSLARVLWLQGLPDQLCGPPKAVSPAWHQSRTLSGQALALAVCSISLFRGDLSAAEHYVEICSPIPTRHALATLACLGLATRECSPSTRRSQHRLRLLRAGSDEPGAAEVQRF